MNISCPTCGHGSEIEWPSKWLNIGIIPVYCEICDNDFWVSIIKELHIVDDNRSGLISDTDCVFNEVEVGDKVICTLEGHPLYDKVCHIVEKKIGHFKVTADGRKLLVPKGCVKLWR